jgi:hypothetical protein
MAPLPESPDLDVLRKDLHRFVHDLSRENYLHYSGQKDTLELSPIYEKFGHLVSKDLAKNILDRWNNAASDDERHSWKHFHHFAFFGYIGNAITGIVEKLAKRQSEMTIEVDGETIGYHSIFPRLVNEPDAEKRRAIDDRASLLETELNVIRMEGWNITNDIFRDFGYASYREGCHKSFLVDYAWLAEELQRFLDETEDAYVQAFDKLSQERLGYPITEAEKCDLGYLMRGEKWDDLFPKENLVEGATAFLAEMGMPVDSTPAVILDVEERPKKRPRAFCSPVEMGKEVYVCVRPMGGMSDYLTFLHELGHACHFAHTDPSLPAELILIGDSATSEIFAFNFNYLGSDPLWLKTWLGIEDPSPIAEFLRLQKLYFLRRYSSKLLYELDLLSDYEMKGLEKLYPQYLDKGLKVKHRVENWLNDLDPAFYSAGYLRAWIFERQMREHFLDEYGRDWWRNPKAGERLRELWRTGRMYMPEAMAVKILGHSLDLGPVTREVMGQT